MQHQEKGNVTNGQRVGEKDEDEILLLKKETGLRGERECSTYGNL